MEEGPPGYVEVVFYVVFGMAYFLAGELLAIVLVFTPFLTTAILMICPIPPISIAGKLIEAAGWIGFIQFGWFVSGALFYLFAKEHKKGFLILGCTAGILAASLNRYRAPEQMGLMAVTLLFALAVTWPMLQRALTAGILLFMGFISYPLYLVHSAILNYLSNSIARIAQVPAMLIPVVPIIGLAGLSWAMAKFWEPWLKSALIKGHNPGL